MSVSMDRTKFEETNWLIKSILEWIVLAQYPPLEGYYKSYLGMNGLKFAISDWLLTVLVMGMFTMFDIPT